MFIRRIDDYLYDHPLFGIQSLYTSGCAYVEISPVNLASGISTICAAWTGAIGIRALAAGDVQGWYTIGVVGLYLPTMLLFLQLAASLGRSTQLRYTYIRSSEYFMILRMVLIQLSGIGLVLLATEDVWRVVMALSTTLTLYVAGCRVPPPVPRRSTAPLQSS